MGNGLFKDTELAHGKGGCREAKEVATTLLTTEPVTSLVFLATPPPSSSEPTMTQTGSREVQRG